MQQQPVHQRNIMNVIMAPLLMAFLPEVVKTAVLGVPSRPNITLILLTTASLFISELKAEPSYDYPTEAHRVGLKKDQIFSPLTWEQTRKGVPKITLLSKKEEEIEYIGDKKDLIDLKLWQESPSRIIYHNGKYHTWIMHLTYFKEVGKIEEARNYYLTSEDGYRWKVEAECPPGEPGSFDDLWREGLQVVAFEGKFWMFYAGNASDGERFGNDLRTGVRKGDPRHGIGLLVADQPEGPWKRATDKPLFVRSDDPEAWDYDMVNNPYPVYFNGKWFIYYKPYIRSWN